MNGNNLFLMTHEERKEQERFEILKLLYEVDEALSRKEIEESDSFKFIDDDLAVLLESEFVELNNLEFQITNKGREESRYRNEIIRKTLEKAIGKITLKSKTNLRTREFKFI